jgi:LemA protein
MTVLTYILIICIIVGIFAICYSLSYNRFQGYIIRSNEAETEIDSILRKRYDLLNKAGSIIIANTDIKNPFKVLDEIKNKKMSNFELDRKLCETLCEYELIKEDNDVLDDNKEFIKVDIEINNSDCSLSALRKYYNATITDYNKSVKKFPSSFVALFSKFKVKNYYDGKDLTKIDTIKL